MRRYRTLSQSPIAPAAGQGVVVRPSPIQRVKVTSLRATFTADAVVANRFLFAQICDPNNVPVFETGSQTAIAAAGVLDLVLSTAFGQATAIQGPVNQGVGLGIPSLWLPPSWTIKLGAVAQDAGDTFTAISYVGEFAEDVWDIEEDELSDEQLYTAILAS